MKSVEFLKSYRMYQPGEIAGFDDALADKLIAGGVAVLPGAKRALKTETADELGRPVDRDDAVVDVASGTEAGNGSGIDLSTVVIETGSGDQSSPAAFETVTGDPGAADAADASGSDDATSTDTVGASGGSAKPSKSASGSSSDTTKKSTAKKA
ncbi:hypothetical protein TM1040_1620 [Ruegeria sp. TM1040]|uniref:hypothetical protein n=1 Tax=Ruegeria sp. (strain TM1040) TaxID=292414 RepID=UPI0000462395|nr:hypothetical protein [Ruegeria sp. TM1040]ABF64353.1 hypothetical protein TM1040_1620 [Ruegeria sp. TM1040]